MPGYTQNFCDCENCRANNLKAFEFYLKAVPEEYSKRIAEAITTDEAKSLMGTLILISIGIGPDLSHISYDYGCIVLKRLEANNAKSSEEVKH